MLASLVCWRPCRYAGAAADPVSLHPVSPPQVVLVHNAWWQFKVVSRVWRIYKRGHEGALRQWMRGDVMASSMRQPVQEYLRQVRSQEDAEVNSKLAVLSIAQASVMATTNGMCPGGDAPWSLCPPP